LLGLKLVVCSLQNCAWGSSCEMFLVHCCGLCDSSWFVRELSVQYRCWSGFERAGSCGSNPSMSEYNNGMVDSITRACPSHHMFGQPRNSVEGYFDCISTY
jgi:hypothetical protein